jgi:hypothetical protein
VAAPSYISLIAAKRGGHGGPPVQDLLHLTPVRFLQATEILTLVDELLLKDQRAARCVPCCRLASQYALQLDQAGQGIDS